MHLLGGHLARLTSLAARSSAAGIPATATSDKLGSTRRPRPPTSSLISRSVSLPGISVGAL